MRQSLMIWQACIIHYIWGIALFVDERASWTTAINAITKYLPSVKFEASLIIIASTLALFSLMSQKRTVLTLVALVPQQVLMMVSAFGAIQASVYSQFADGVVRPFWFIFSDQSPYIVVMILHTLAILEEYAGEWWKAIGLQLHR
jgi:hypothetical protein